MKQDYYSPTKTEGFIPLPEEPKRCPLVMIGTQGRESKCLKENCAMYDTRRDCCGVIGRTGDE